MDKGIKNIILKIKDSKFIKIAIIIFLVILILLIIFGNKINKTNTESSSQTLDYSTVMEEKLSNILSKIDGAGKVTVAISVESGTETVLAMKTVTKETGNIKETEETPILVNGKTVVLKELNPKINGVLIIAEGANNIMVMKKIQQATLALLDVNINEIEILGMK